MVACLSDEQSATLALENGMDVKTLSAMLGHVSAVTTLDIYTHITGDMQRAAAASIDCTRRRVL